MLPLLPATTRDTNDLNPWLLLRHHASGEIELALWKIEMKGDALIVFSSADKAEEYLVHIDAKDRDRAISSPTQSFQATASNWSIMQPDEMKLGHILIPYFRHGIRWLVLDPTVTEAKLIYSLPEVLKGLQNRLSEISRSKL